MTNLIDWNNAHITKISIRLHGHATSFSLEKPFLDILKDAARQNNIALAQLVGEIDTVRPATINLSSALRLYALKTIKAQQPNNPPL